MQIRHLDRMNTTSITPAAAAMLATLVFAVVVACAPETPPPPGSTASTQEPAVVAPVVVTEQTPVDSDDPAIWINPDDPSQSLILGTDKGGAVVVFDLDGKIIPEQTVTGLQRMNNIDVEYGFSLGD